jgi:hypothetical protein
LLEDEKKFLGKLAWEGKSKRLGRVPYAMDGKELRRKERLCFFNDGDDALGAHRHGYSYAS